MLQNRQQSYGWISITLHWLMGFMVIGMFLLGVWMTSLDYYSPWYHDAPELHKSIGVLLFFLLLFRWVWRITQVRPVLMGKLWEQQIALLVHRMHYLLLFVIVITGYLIPTAEGVGIELFHLFTLPATFTFSKTEADWIGSIHHYSAWASMGLVTMHAAAALKHHFVDKDHTLLRMLGMSQK